MGLDIYFGNLEEYLVRKYSDTPSPRTAAVRAMDLIRSEVEKQLGHRVEVVESRLKRYPLGFKYGPYSAIHVLRVYACRIAGFHIAEAYDMPETRVGLLPGADLQDQEEADEESSTYDFEREIERDWGIKLDKVVPLPARKRKPFPFQNLVCFSDAEGIYVPVQFPSPIVVDEAYIGSSVQLALELRSVGQDLRRRLQAARLDSRGHAFLSEVSSLWRMLQGPCKVSIRKRVCLIFG